VLAKPVLKQRHFLFRQNKLQTAISSVGQAGAGAAAFFYFPPDISSSHMFRDVCSALSSSRRV